MSWGNPKIIQVDNTYYCVRKRRKNGINTYSFLISENEFSTIYRKAIHFKNVGDATDALENCLKKIRLEKIKNFN